MFHQLLSGLSIPTGGISSLAHTKVNGSCTQVHMRTSRCLCSGVETNLLNFGLSTLAAENSNRNCRLPMLSADPEKCRLSLPHLHLQDFNSAFSPTHHRVLMGHACGLSFFGRRSVCLRPLLLFPIYRPCIDLQNPTLLTLWDSQTRNNPKRRRNKGSEKLPTANTRK